MSYRSIHSLPGPAGPPGAGGGGGGGTTTHVQTFAVPDTTWTVTHSLGTDTPMVALYDLNGSALGDADVYAPDTSTVVITFAVPVAGRAVIQA